MVFRYYVFCIGYYSTIYNLADVAMIRLLVSRTMFIFICNKVSFHAKF